MIGQNVFLLALLKKFTIFKQGKLGLKINEHDHVELRSFENVPKTRKVSTLVAVKDGSSAISSGCRYQISLGSLNGFQISQILEGIVSTMKHQCQRQSNWVRPSYKTNGLVQSHAFGRCPSIFIN